MRVFSSWSGSYTRQIAEAFADWIPCVLQTARIFISSGDIQAGERWQSKINAALLDIDFGIVFLTKENKEKPWIMFEAGALAKNLDDSRVVPILCDAREIDFEKSPLLQFQYVYLDKDGIYSLMKSIHGSMETEGVSDRIFSKSFETWWPQLEDTIKEIEPLSQESQDTKPRTKDERLDRIESSVSDMLGMLKNISKREPIRVGRPTIRALDFFALDEANIYDYSIPAASLVRAAQTREEIERSIKYIRRKKNTNLQNQTIPTLEDRLKQLGN